ncbi:MAG TPA: YfhO family protein [Candidatus Hydrogenedentes bacterium]|nr:YfhO family protein [Candidatus Hydrogenedentota bacterium]
MILFGRKRIDASLSFLLLFVIPILTVFLPIFQGKLPARIPGVVFEPPWQEALSPASSSSEGLNEVSLTWFPTLTLLGQSLKKGEPPLWNPYEAMGVPLLATWKARVLSPFSIPFYVVGPRKAVAISIFFKLLAAGICAWWVARRFGFRPPIAFMAGALYQVCAPVFAFRLDPVSDAYVWFPLLAWNAHNLLMARPRYWRATAITFLLIGLGGSPELLIASVICFWAMLVSYRLRVRGLDQFTSASLGALTAMLFAGGMLAIQILPYSEYLGESVAAPAGVSDWSPGRLAVLLFPVFSVEHRSGMAPIFSHVGIPVGVLCCLWIALHKFANRQRRRRLDAFGGVTLVFYLIAAGYAAFPLDSQGWPLPNAQHWLLPLPLWLVFMAATVAEEWLELDARTSRQALARFLVALGVFFILCAGTGIYMALVSGTAYSPAWWLGVILSGIAMVLLILITLVWPKPRLLGYGVALICFAWATWTYYPFTRGTPLSEVFPETFFTRVVRDAGGRVAGTDNLTRWPLSVHGIAQVYNPDGVTLRRYAVFKDRLRQYPLLARRAAASVLLLSRQDIQGAYAATRPDFNIQEVFPSGVVLIRDFEALPRARMLYAGKVVDRFAPESLVPGSASQVENGMLPEKADGTITPAETRILKDGLCALTVQVKGTRPGILVLADTWYPGWKAWVDGSPARICRVDGLFRGVELGEGDHTVEFRFQPASLTLGAVITMLSFALWVLAGVRLPRLPFRKRQNIPTLPV